MILSDISIKRPVFASVISLLLIAFGVLAFERLPLREYPDIDPPVVSISTNYPGAAASVVETRITQVIEDRISGVEGVRFVESSSKDGRSDINVEFDIGRDMESAANDIRDRVARVLDDLPQEADTPDVQKVDSNEDVIMWLNLSSDRLTVPELTDYAERYLVDRFSTVDGVARVRVGGGQRFAMRVWIDRVQLAAHNLTVREVEASLRAENVELPAGALESVDRLFRVRVERSFANAEDFSQLVLAQGDDGYLVRLGDVARVEKGTEETRTFFRGNGEAMVGIGITKQSTANTIDVARGAKEAAARINPGLPEGMQIRQSYDTSVFIEEAINEVYKTLAIAIFLVILVIYLFLGSARAMLVPAVTVPVSLIATFILLALWGFTVNLLTLLAMVLAIGLVVDDAIVVLENIHRRMEEYGETALVAAYRGTRQVGFAVVATTLVLVAVFAPIAVLEGDLGRLFGEFALTMSAAVVFSSLVALTLSAMLASKVLRPASKSSGAVQWVDSLFAKFQFRYNRWVEACIKHPLWVVLVFVLLLVASIFMASRIPSEFAPKEDRGAFFVMINGPEGASFSYMKDYMDEIEQRLLPFAESGEAERVLVRAPRAWGLISSFNHGMVIMVLSDWSERRSAWDIMDDVQQRLSDLPGVRAFAVMRQGIGSRVAKPVQFVIGGGTYEELAEWQEVLLSKIAEENPKLVAVDTDYKDTNPQIQVNIDYNRAAELGVSVQNIGRTLESILGTKRVTTFIDEGEEYDVLVEGERSLQNSPTDISSIYVRSERSGELIPLANLVTLSEFAVSNSLNRYNRTRAITLEANLADGYALGDALEYLENLVERELPEHVLIDYKGQSQDFKFSGDSVLFAFGLGILVMFLVLAAQFESYISPFIIMFTVPLAMAGGLLGLWLTGGTFNLYSQIGLIMLIGLATKNGILIVEFANQLRDQQKTVREAILEASRVRLRPIVMTSLTTVIGSLPLIFSFGAGAETRAVLGITLFFGVTVATLFSLFLIPVMYDLFARFAGSPQAVAQRLERELESKP
ncbi:efflux RND transporter permease subunit [Teredinibacter waterburyi]|uniref:efflux RND transporter permease subunit n=1 Tax=Teredinibacter waterburyi TaxID=1500538 RepID=UPI00165ED017|nr:efflux RND transporter permease subunit [Teredinibacter waterburyi]